MPISTVITNLIKLGIQLLIFFGVYVYFLLNGMNNVLDWKVLLFPFLCQDSINLYGPSLRSVIFIHLGSCQNEFSSRE